MKLFIVLLLVFIGVGCSDISVHTPNIAEEPENNQTLEITVDAKNNQKFAIPRPTWEVNKFTSGNADMIGIPNKIAIHNGKIIEGNANKFIWYFWGAEKEFENMFLTVIAIKKDSVEPTKALVVGVGTKSATKVWSIKSHFPKVTPLNGANAHIPSTIELPSKGLWSLNAFVNNQLYGQIIVEVMDEASSLNKS